MGLGSFPPERKSWESSVFEKAGETRNRSEILAARSRE